MPLPTPEAGLVVHYEFLWSHEHADGATEGEKRRPALIIAATKEGNETTVILAPITHLMPRGTGTSVEIPTKVKAHLGLDEDRSWVILTELNKFTWPGFHLYQVPNSPPGTFEYGFIPPALFKQIKESIVALDATFNSAIPRDDK